jgi:predicted TPR repeat methyltransferase
VNASGAPVVELTAWSGPWPNDDPDANFKADVALYAHVDPLRTLRGLSGATGIPIGALVRYVLGRWASEGASGLLELGPTMTRRLVAVTEAAETTGTDEARLEAYHQLREMLSWLAAPLDHPEYYDEPIDRVQRARSLSSVGEARELYDRWAVSYDADIYGALNFVGPDVLADRVAQLVNSDDKVLDVGCGTGAMGERLRDRGFRALDGLDLSPKMLRIAGHKQVYGSLIEADLTRPLRMVATGAYDAVVSAGTFVSGHVTAAALDELCRVIKPGGHLIATVMNTFWGPGGFDERIATLEAGGVVDALETTSAAATPDSSTTIRILVLRRRS